MSFLVIWSFILLLQMLQSLVFGFYIIEVDASVTKRPLQHFWKSTGFCPPLPHNRSDVFDSSKDQQLNLAYVSSVPQSGIEQIRIHWLLDLITIETQNERLHYNFTILDNFLDLLWENGLRPGFELMGSPSGYFMDFEDKMQVIAWKNLVSTIAKRYIGFHNYYDACSEGLKEASSLLRFGGPGDSCRPLPKSPICWSLLSHCYNGTNFFTGEAGVRLDYVALHKKGQGSSLYILEQEVETIKEIQKRFPKFSSVPIYNDEADPLVGWSTPQIWRADVTYAAMVVKIIIQHQNLLISNASNKVNYSLLSNDNAFMSYHPHYFTQRTLAARFQMNNTKPPHVQMVRKPVLTVMGLLAFLGETQISANIYSKDEESDVDTVGVIATSHDPAQGHSSDSWQSTILIYNSDDNRTSSNISYVTVNLTNFPKHADLVYVTSYMDNNVTNPYLEWKNLGSPDFPTIKQFQQIRDAEDPVVEGPLPFPKEGKLYIKVELPVPSLFLIHVCARATAPPDQVTGVRLMPLMLGQVAVVWNDECIHSKCLKTFEVEFSEDGNIYRRINAKNIVFTLFVYSPECSSVSGFYRIRAVDYWGKPGLFSIPVKYIETP
ncbi:alpha-L-iduronidase isoform X2 [Microcaecilia unicolor]|uniref:Alpha-L-iduronidase isoform X2 n=1 Tax=Microcaecilia unicolor TaxID=1415580 RepID=A0A6P7XI42_9AMPH|nr:alpha-L-iduronidase isoform X2 [Microcaecilia unicolor]